MWEWGDRVPNGSRNLPIFATLTFDLNSVEPLLTAVITNAVLEGGEPFTLTVRSASGARLPDGAYWFSGDYLQDLYPSGTQYLFDWEFATSTNGTVAWNGTIAWVGGHAWYVAITNLTLVPVPKLTVSHAGYAMVQITWATNFIDYVLEATAELPAVNWNRITNLVTNTGNRLSVTIDTEFRQQFYRLRQP